MDAKQAKAPPAETEESDIWLPNLSPKQLEVFNCYSPVVLLSGSRKGGKTIVIGHRVIRHMWETPGARIAIFSKTIKNATDGGIWDDLIKIIMPEWVDSGIGIEFTTYDANGVPGPKTDPGTKTLYFKIKNQYGGESELKLFSLDHDKDVEKKIKGTRFSLIWFSELSLFEDMDILKVSLLQLRMVHLKDEQHMFIADTNPHEDGPDNWIYKYWFINRTKQWPTPEENEHWAGFALFEFFLHDNPFLSKKACDQLKFLYADDQDGYDRNVLGKWVKNGSGKGRHFAPLFSEQTHVIGDEENDAIDIDPNTIELYTSWDPGSVNTSAHILEKRLVNGKAVWIVHDEQVLIGDQTSTEDFTVEFVAKMDALEQHYGKKYIWKHWSDDSAITTYRASAGKFDYEVILAASDGRVLIEAAPKPEVKVRVKLLRQLLRENRIFIASRCRKTIQMMKECRKGSTNLTYVESNEHKHPFDSLTYGIYAESLEDLMDATNRPVTREPGSSSLIGA